MAGHFSVDQATIKSILDPKLRLRTLTRRSMPHSLSVEQKSRRVPESQNMLTVLTNLAEKTFRGSFQCPEEILRSIQEVRSHFTFKDFQNVFKSWMERLTWVIANNWKSCHQKSRLENNLI
jgi:hypothetical protein